jgi:integrase
VVVADRERGVTGAPLRAVPTERPRSFAELVRPEFCVELYLPPRNNPYLYGQHCAVENCERPGNELIVDARRLCQRHAQRYRQAGVGIETFLAAAPLIAARSELTGLPRYDLTAASVTTRDELRLLLQAIHDGQFSLTFSTKRWNALRAVYAEGGAASLIDIDLAAQPPARVATASAKRFQRFLTDTRDRLAGVEPSRRDDVWPRGLYESFAKPMQGRPPTRMDFTRIRLAWLREAAKEVAWQRMGVEGISPTTAWDMVQDVIRFERWAGARLRTPQQVSRSLLIDWLAHNRATLPARAVSQRLSRLRLFLDHARVGGLAISADATYLPGELGIRGELDRPPKHLDDAELAQLDAPENLARLGDFDRRAYLVLRHTGMRTRSLVHMPFDCLAVVEGAPYLTFSNTKHRGGPQEHTIPISPELADVVREQQRWVRSFWPDERPTWLFPARCANPTGGRPAHGNSIYNALVKWVRACGIETGDGGELHFWPHRLRHTLGTQMINEGVSQRAVQDYYGHASPEMTAHYAKLLDRTLRREFDAFGQRVNRRGERIDVLPAGVPGDAVMLKERIARAKQTLPNGYCGIPIQSRCPHPNACLSCDAFLTDESFRPVLVEQRARAQERADSGAAAGLDRVAELNLADVAALDAVVAGLDEVLATAPDEAFDLREFGAA